jgi:hypothetical protein
MQCANINVLEAVGGRRRRRSLAKNNYLFDKKKGKLFFTVSF